MFDIAILQGRLSPDLENRFQFFPTSHWRDEFFLAKDLGFDGIEWLVDPVGWEENPVFDDARYAEAEASAQEAKLPITSICADWFMTVCIWEGDPEFHRAKIREVLPKVQKTAHRVLLIPLLEAHTITSPEIQKKVVEVLKPLGPELEALGVSIGFETELSATELQIFLAPFESASFGVYYDIGNCTSYGFDCPLDIRQLGGLIKGIHVKDRKVGTTSSVRLGEGDADFIGVIRALREIGWSGSLVLQAWRGEGYIEDAQKQLAFIKHCIANA